MSTSKKYKKRSQEYYRHFPKEKKLMKELVQTLETKTCQMWLGKEKKNI